MGKLRQLIQNRLPAGSFARNVVTLMTGTTFAQALMVLVAPILTRIYSPADLGIYALYTSVASIITVFACWSYDFAIVLPEKDEDAANVLNLSILLCLGMSGLTLMIVTIFRIPVASFLNAPELELWLWCMPLSVLGVGLFKSFNYWSTRHKQFKRLALRQITQSTITSATQIGVGATFHTGPGGLIGGFIAGQLVATGQLALQVVKEEGYFLNSRSSIRNLKQVAIQYKKFPLYDSWSESVNTASNMLPVLLLGYFFSPEVVGFYALGHRVLAMPMNVIGSSVAQVFFPRATKAHRDKDLNKVTLSIFEQLLNIGFVPVMLIAIVAPDLFALVFGERWLTAGDYVRWISLWLFFQFISSPISTVFYVAERQKDLLIFNLIMFSLRLIVIIVSGMQGEALFAIALLGITGAVLYAFLCIYILSIVGIAVFRVFRVILKQVAFGIPYCAVPLLVWYIARSPLAFVLAATVSGFFFLIINIPTMNKK